MSVHVTDTTNADGTWTIVDDDNGHTNQVDPNTLTYGQNPDGTENRDIVVIPCPEPGCDTVSWWPREVLPPEVTAKLA